MPASATILPNYTYFTLDIKAVDKSLEIVDKFNQLNIIDKAIKVNIPQVWYFKDESSDEWSGQRFLCEPFIRNYQKFNSNTGWNDSSIAWGEAMQALSYFSYHITGGNYVLCDLQGGIYQRETVLSDPVILSRNRDYGVTDLGSAGIGSFSVSITAVPIAVQSGLNPLNRYYTITQFGAQPWSGILCPRVLHDLE